MVKVGLKEIYRCTYPDGSANPYIEPLGMKCTPSKSNFKSSFVFSSVNSIRPCAGAGEIYFQSLTERHTLIKTRSSDIADVCGCFFSETLRATFADAVQFHVPALSTISVSFALAMKDSAASFQEYEAVDKKEGVILKNVALPRMNPVTFE